MDGLGNLNWSIPVRLPARKLFSGVDLSVIRWRRDECWIRAEMAMNIVSTAKLDAHLPFLPRTYSEFEDGVVISREGNQINS